jgi:hypothetical protein
MRRFRAVVLGGVMAAVPLLVGCPGSDSVLGVTAGSFTYSLTEKIPLPQTSCVATASGSTNVASDGSYSITFPQLSCSGCTMSALTSGVLNSTAISGQVVATLAGSGCTNEAPTPNPAAVSGKCSSAGCTANTADGDSFSVTYTLTPP